VRDDQQKGWRALVCLVEIGYGGFVATSTIRLWKELGNPQPSPACLHQTIKETATLDRERHSTDSVQTLSSAEEA